MEKIPLNRFANITSFTKCNYIAECNEWAADIITAATYSGTTNYWKIQFSDPSNKVFYLQSSSGSPDGKNLQDIGFADGCTIILKEGNYPDGHFLRGCRANRILVKPGDHVSISNDYRDFYLSPNLKEIGDIDCSNANMSGFAAYSPNLSRLGIYGMRNSFTISSTYVMKSLTRHDEILRVINNLGDATDKSTPPTLTISAHQNNKLTDDERQIATDKGWKIAIGD